MAERPPLKRSVEGSTPSWTTFDEKGQWTVGITAKDLGWMAGVIDLKGRIVLKSNQTRVTKQAVLTVQTGEMGVIRRLGDLTGTAPEVMKAKPLKDFMRKNCIAHCPEAHVHSGTEDLMMPTSARWTITGAGLVVVLFSLVDMMATDRGFAEIMEATMAVTTIQGPGAGQVRAQLRRLRGLGWALPDRYTNAIEPEPAPARLRLPERDSLATDESITEILRELEAEQAGKSS